MFAVIKTGGKQYRVAADDRLQVDRLAGEPGDTVTFEDVLMLGGETPAFGAPTVSGASVAAEIVEHGRGRKIIIFKKRRRKNSRRKNGHRQDYTLVQITDILTDGKAPAKARKAATKPKPARSEPKKADPAKETAGAAPAAKGDELPKLFDAPAGEPDDLKKISGVGPVLEKKLHALGITTYVQIASFSKDDVQHVDDALSFKGRIGREDWIGQSRALAAESAEDSEEN